MDNLVLVEPNTNPKDVLCELKKIKSLSKKITKKVLPLMKDVENDEFISEFCNSFSIYVSKKKTREILKDILYEITNDPFNILEEISVFSDLVSENKESEMVEKTPFLAQVWLGDLYDENPRLSLTILKNSLKKLLEKLDRQGYFLRKAEKMIEN